MKVTVFCQKRTIIMSTSPLQLSHSAVNTIRWYCMIWIKLDNMDKTGKDEKQWIKIGWKWMKWMKIYKGGGNGWKWIIVDKMDKDGWLQTKMDEINKNGWLQIRMEKCVKEWIKWMKTKKLIKLINNWTNIFYNVWMLQCS